MSIPSFPRPRPGPLAVALAAVLIASGCGSLELAGRDGSDPTIPTTTTIDGGSDGGGGGDGDGSTTSTTVGQEGRDPAVDQRLRDFLDWDAPVQVSTDDRTMDPKRYQAGGYDVSCQITGSRELAPAPFDDFAAFVFDGDLVPGLIVQGRGVLEGDLRPVPLERAPLTLSMDLASANPTAVVDNPTSSALTQAVAKLKSDADARLTGIDVVPAQIDYVLEETSSYEESMLQMGVSARYDSGKLDVGFSSAFDQRQSEVEHAVTMRLLQPMFTVRVDRSQVQGPGDYTSTATTVDGVDRLVDNGTIGPDNVPVLIDQVTYGRAVYVTILSSEAESSQELRAAADAAYGGFSGSAELTTRQRALMASSTIRGKAFGGNQEVALGALRNGEIKDFLRSVDTSNAIPLTFTMRTLDGNLISVADRATIQDIGCTRTPIPEARTVWAVEAYSGGAWIDVFVNSTKVGTIERNSRTTRLDLTPYMDEGRSNEFRVHVWPDTCLTNPSVGITIIAKGQQKSRRIQDGVTCDWWSTWTLNDADDTVVNPDNWHTGG